jgi:beta-glucuronidase
MKTKRLHRRVCAGTLTILCLGISAVVHAASGVPDPAPIQNALARPGLSLDGEWSVIIDPYENGYYNHRYQPKTDGYFQDRRPQAPADLVEYSFDDSPTLTVPGDWNSQDPKLFLYEGTLWYRQRFELAPLEGRRYFLHFGAVNYRADIWLNGEFAGTHEGPSARPRRAVARFCGHGFQLPVRRCGWRSDRRRI